MRYMFLIYSQEREASNVDMSGQIRAHYAVMDEATEKGVFRGAEPLRSTASATSIRVSNGRPMVTDGPFAETKEQLAGYYIIDCQNLDEAIEWAKKIPTCCGGGEGCGIDA